MEIITYGGIITSVHAPDRDGNIADITTGFDTLSGKLSMEVTRAEVML